MTVGLLGRKVGMTQLFNPTGEIIPVTVLEAGPCHVLQVKTLQSDGYEAVQFGYGNKPRRLASRSARGHVAKLDSKRQRRLAAADVKLLSKAGCEPKRWIREFRGTAAGYEVGQEIKVDIFSQIQAVDVIGTTKGRGTAGVMKRHNYRGQRASHGVKKVHRHPGSTGRNTDPARMEKGHRMAGRYGSQRVTQRNLKVIRVDLENNLLVVCGAVPGPNGGFVIIRETNKLG